MIQSPLSFNHSLLKDFLEKGHTVIDATVGNGHDFLFLLKHIGPTGKAYGFDIQQAAIDSTEEACQSLKSAPSYQLIHDSHANILQYVEKDSVHAIMFNLGYLPKGDKSIITKPDSTIDAIAAGLKALKQNGIMTLMIYYGHEGGNDERIAVENYLTSLNQKAYTVMRYQPLNQQNTPPYLIIIEKL